MPPAAERPRRNRGRGHSPCGTRSMHRRTPQERSTRNSPSRTARGTARTPAPPCGAGSRS